jgi:hypothetical protein
LRKRLWPSNPPRRNKRGFILVVAMFFLILLGFIGTSLIGLLPMEFRSSTRNHLDVQAHYAVVSGIRFANNWFSAVITPGKAAPGNNPDAPADYYNIADDKTSHGGWGTTDYNFSGDIMAVKANDPWWERKRLKDLKFPADGYSFISNGRPFSNTGNALCGYSATSPDPDNTDVVATKKPIVMGDWQVWVAFVPHNDQDTPGSKAGGRNFNVIANSRAYQMVSVAFYQGQPYMRAKAMIREASTAKFARLMGTMGEPDDSAEALGISGAQFELGANKKETTLYEGPVHSNDYLRMSVAPEVWQTTQNTAFKGIVSYAKPADVGDPAWNRDDILWSSGNYGAFEADRRPFTGANDNTPVAHATDPTKNRYDALIKNGKSNLQQTKPVAFPQDSKKLFDAAFGRALTPGLNQVSSTYTSSNIPDGTFGNWRNQVEPEVTADGTVDNNAPKKPDGLFINHDANGALGGIYVNGDVKSMFLEAVDQHGTPETNATALASGTQNSSVANLNSGIRVQEQKLSTRAVTITRLTTTTGSQVVPVSTGTNWTTRTATTITTATQGTTNSQVVTTTFTTCTSTQATTATTYTSCTSTNNVNVTLFTTQRGPRVTTSYSTVRCGTQVTSRWQSDASGSGAGSWIRTTNYTSCTNAATSTQANQPISTSSQITQTRVLSTNRCGTNRTPTSTVNVGRCGTNRATAVTQVPNRVYSTQLAPVVTHTLTTASATRYTTATNSQPVEMMETWHAVDRAIIPKNDGGGMNIPINKLDMVGSQFTRPAGSANNSFLFDDSHADFAKVHVVNSDGSVTTKTSGNIQVGEDQILVLKQSRTDPSEVYAFMVPKRKGADGSIKGDGTNGSVYVSGNINGVGGVNLGKRTIAVQNNQLGSKEISIADNVLQFGTAPGEKPDTHVNGLGMIANNINIVAQNDKFGTGATDRLLIYGILLAGKSDTNGGLRLKRAIDARDENGNFLKNFFSETTGGISRRLLLPSEVQAYNSRLNTVNDGHINYDMRYLLGDYKNWQSSTPFFRLFGGLLERNPKIIYYHTPAGWQSSFAYDQELANNPPPFWPTQGKPEIVSYQEEKL